MDDFVFQQPPEIRIELETETVKPANDDDFDVIPEKKAKRAPRASSKTDTVKSKPAKTSRKKKQTTIKSAFMRNEQLFAEIAAQHCAADNFDIDDVQLAIAISRSEAESKGIIANDDNEVPPDVKEGGEKNAELIRQKLEKYGFRTAEKEGKVTIFLCYLNCRSISRFHCLALQWRLPFLKILVKRFRYIVK